jgi:AcrR family transcriptional regulator
MNVSRRRPATSPTLSAQSAPRAQRRTQEQRSEETRARLLEATVDCLVEYGYVGTTTSRVAEKSGLTRGAQVHHFGSKDELVVAALGYTAARIATSALEEIRRIPKDADPVEMGLDLLWRLHRGPIFIAFAELWVAARTDAALAEHVRKVEPIIAENMMLAVGTASLGVAANREIRHFFYSAMDMIRGILLTGFALYTADQLESQWRRARGHLLLLARAVAAENPNLLSAE